MRKDRCPLVPLYMSGSFPFPSCEYKIRYRVMMLSALTELCADDYTTKHWRYTAIAFVCTVVIITQCIDRASGLQCNSLS